MMGFKSNKLELRRRNRNSLKRSRLPIACLLVVEDVEGEQHSHLIL
jgi:hypothetical protein